MGTIEGAPAKPKGTSLESLLISATCATCGGALTLRMTLAPLTDTVDLSVDPCAECAEKQRRFGAGIMDRILEFIRRKQGGGDALH